MLTKFNDKKSKSSVERGAPKRAEETPNFRVVKSPPAREEPESQEGEGEAHTRRNEGKGGAETADQRRKKKQVRAGTRRELANLACVSASPLIFRTSGASSHCSGAEGVAFDQRDLEVHDHVTDGESNAWLGESSESWQQFEDSLTDESVSFEGERQ